MKKTLTFGQLSALSGLLLVVEDHLDHPTKETRVNLKGLVRVSKKFIKEQYALKGIKRI